MVQTTVVSPYADYDFYVNVYHGNAIAESEFERLESRAEDELNAMTFYRIPGMDARIMTDLLATNIRKAVCAIAELQSTGESLEVGISSESNDGYSVSYTQTARKDVEAQQRTAAARYIADSGLLYRGGGDWYVD